MLAELWTLANVGPKEKVAALQLKRMLGNTLPYSFGPFRIKIKPYFINLIGFTSKLLQGKMFGETETYQNKILKDLPVDDSTSSKQGLLKGLHSVCSARPVLPVK